MSKNNQNLNEIIFFTTFNKPGYELYGKDWVKSFEVIANENKNVKAIIFYEDFTPKEHHPSIKWMNYKQTFTFHTKWKEDFLKISNHHSYIKEMTVKFSHKSFVIQYMLKSETNKYLIWLDGDVIFKKATYINFPFSILKNTFMACQLEKAQFHIESGILIFDSRKKEEIKIFNDIFEKEYKIENLLKYKEPYDGFVLYKSLILSNLNFIDLNIKYGFKEKQADPSTTFLNPELSNRFTHNIGYVGKATYKEWDRLKNHFEVPIHLTRIGLVSGGFDPIHSGHIEYLKDAKEKVGATLCVALNSDEWLKRKKGNFFMTFEERKKIIESIKYVDFVIEFDDSDNTALNAIEKIEKIYPHAMIVFMNGGDRTKENIPEMKTKVKNVRFIFGVGGLNKKNSSTLILKNWEDWIKNK